MWGGMLLLVREQGPPSNRGFSGYTLVLAAAVIIIILLVVIATILLFPRLRNVKPSRPVEPEVRRIEETEKGRGADVEPPMQVTLRLLGPDEKRVVEALREAGGSMLQKDISYELGLSRVRTHRILVTLIERNIVNAEKYFNTNRITLSDWLKEK